jgi:hypothetical protein
VQGFLFIGKTAMEPYAFEPGNGNFTKNGLQRLFFSSIM